MRELSLFDNRKKKLNPSAWYQLSEKLTKKSLSNIPYIPYIPCPFDEEKLRDTVSRLVFCLLTGTWWQGVGGQPWFPLVIAMAIMFVWPNIRD